MLALSDFDRQIVLSFSERLVTQRSLLAAWNIVILTTVKCRLKDDISAAVFTNSTVPVS